MSDKKWKAHLLSSGVPLEHSVRKALRSVGFIETPRYEFRQPDENNAIITRSVDAHARKNWEKKDGGIDVEYLVECKYSAPNRQWVFFPVEGSADALSDILNIFDDFSGEFWLGNLRVKASEAIPPSENGVVVDNNSGSTAEIRSGLYQLKYATLHRAVELIESQLDWLDFLVNPAVVVLPVLVTTADLWRVKDCIEIADVLCADSLESIAHRQSAVVVRTPSSVRESAYMRQLLKQRLSSDQYNLLMSKRRLRGGAAVVPWLEHSVAGSVVVVTLERFRAILDRQVAYFSSLELQPRPAAS